MNGVLATNAKQTVSIACLQRDFGTPALYTPQNLNLVKEMLAKCLDPLGGISSFTKPDSVVVIKVNAGFSGPPGVYTTDPRVVEALVVLLQECVRPREIIIAENAAEFHMLEEIGIGSTTMDCFQVCGFSAIAERRNVKLVALEGDLHEQVTIPGATLMTHCLVPRTILNADTLIFVPHLKNHIACGVTLNIKLNQGVIPTSEKKQFHNSRLSEKLLDLLKIVSPHLCVIDGLWAMQGQGPTSQFPNDVIRDMNVLVAGTNPVAVDMVGAMLIGLDLKDVPVLVLAEQMGIMGSDAKSINLVGSPIESCAKKFRTPEKALNGVFPNIVVYKGEACDGCVSHLRIYLDHLMVAGILQKLNRTLTIIVGRHCAIPNIIDQPVLVVGDCASEYRDLGLFVSGCCPLSHIFRALLDQISLICDLEQFRCHPT